MAELEASTVKVLIVEGTITDASEALVREITGRAAAEGLSV